VVFVRALGVALEDIRRQVAEMQGRGYYVSVQAVRRASLRTSEEQAALYAWDGERANPEARAKLRAGRMKIKGGA
jgi:hypothetical protein